MRSIRWQFFPQFEQTPDHLLKVVNVFKKNYEKINSDKNKYSSIKVLKLVAYDLKSLDYKVEGSKKIKLPVLIGENNKTLKRFEVDAYNEENQTIIEVEAGQAVDNNNFMKDLFKACLIQNIDYLVISVRITYSKNNNFETIINFIKAIYTSNRLKLPLKGCLVVGY